MQWHRSLNQPIKDPVTAVLALRAHFFTADKYLFADENQEESKHNDTSFDLLLRYQASSYCSGEKHKRRAQDVKRQYSYCLLEQQSLVIAR